jgi:hypothetical protein
MTFSIRNNTIKIEKSHHGSGVFANANFEAGDYLGTIIKKISHTNTPEDYFRTAMGRYIKHSENPNTNIVALENDRYGLTANNNISNGEELFINYEVMAKIIGFPFKPLSKQAGLFQPPPEMVKLIWEWVLPRYASLVFRKTKDISLKEKAGKDCDFNFFDYQDYKTTIPISLEGWKYEGLQTEEWKGIWDDVKVEMFKTPEPEYVGQYDDKDNTIRIVLDEQWLNPSPNNYEMLKNTILRNIEHEVIHLGQYIFKHFKNLEFGGMPSKSISDPAYDPEGFSNMPPDPETGENYLTSKDHPLREIEFYALLNDAKIELKHQIERWPNMKDVIFQRLVGIIPSHDISIPQEFFLKLKEQEPEKWQKAVKELYKTIDKFDLSKRAAEKILYEIKLQPSENQLEYFLKQEGVWFNPLKDRPNPDYLQEKNSYFIGVEKAFKYAFEELKALSFILGFTIITEKLDYRTRGENIYPAKIIIEADPYTAAQLKTHPVVRNIKEKEITINEVYV